MTGLPPDPEQNFISQPPASQPSENQTSNNEPTPVRVVNIPLATRDVSENELGVFEKSTLRYARWDFIVAVVTLIFVVLTALVFWDQFREMSSQTDILAISARQARRDSAESSISTQKQLAISRQQADSASKQARAALQSAQTIQDEMELSERPWVSVSNAAIASPVTIDITGKIGTRVRLHIVNLGKTPAVSLYFKPLQVTNSIGYPILKQLCSVANRGDNNYGPAGMNLFPGEAVPDEQNRFYGSGQATRYMSETMLPSRTIIPLKYPTYDTSMTVVGCIVYRPSFTTKKRYYTGFIYNLWTGLAGKFLQFGGVPNPRLGGTVVPDGVTTYEIPPSDTRLWLETAGGMIMK